MFSTFLIGLREGLEAALIVGILAGCLVKADRREMLRYVTWGVAAAIAGSLALGAALTFTSATMSERSQEIFEGVISIVAVVFVTTMVFWMKRTSKAISSELSANMSNALSVGGFAVFGTAFAAVIREGLETALFLWPAFQAGRSAAVWGAVFGLTTASVIGVLIYRQSVRFNLAKFFKVSGIALIVIAGGVLASGVHELQEAGLLGGEENLAFDVSSRISSSSWWMSVLKGSLNVRTAMSWLEIFTYVLFVAITLVLFLRPASVKPVKATVN